MFFFFANSETDDSSTPFRVGSGHEPSRGRDDMVLLVERGHHISSMVAPPNPEQGIGNVAVVAGSFPLTHPIKVGDLQLMGVEPSDMYGHQQWTNPWFRPSIDRTPAANWSMSRMQLGVMEPVVEVVMGEIGDQPYSYFKPHTGRMLELSTSSSTGVAWSPEDVQEFHLDLALVAPSDDTVRFDNRMFDMVAPPPTPTIDLSEEVQEFHLDLALVAPSDDTVRFDNRMFDMVAPPPTPTIDLSEEVQEFHLDLALVAPSDDTVRFDNRMFDMVAPPPTPTIDLSEEVQEFSRGFRGVAPSDDTVRMAGRIVDAARIQELVAEFYVDDSDGSFGIMLRLPNRLLLLAELSIDGTLSGGTYNDVEGTQVEFLAKTTVEQITSLF